MTKIYTLELTAEELEFTRKLVHNSPALSDRLADLYSQAKADREADELRLPWRAERYTTGNNGDDWEPVRRGYNLLDVGHSERAAKLMSAAPELLEAVQGMERRFKLHHNSQRDDEKLLSLIDRALRKVETGIPES